MKYQGWFGAEPTSLAKAPCRHYCARSVLLSKSTLAILVVILGMSFLITDSAAQTSETPQTTQDSLRLVSQQLDSLKAEMQQTKHERNWIRNTIIALALIVGGFVAYIIILQLQVLKECRETKQLTTFLKTPAGLPVGTIRSLVTMIIVTFSLYLIILSAFKVTGSEYPEVLAAVLSTVVGFYFGSRTAARQDTALVEETQKQLNEAVAKQDESKAKTLITKVGKNIALVRTVLDLLPEDKRKKYSPFLDKLEKGVKVAEGLAGKGVFDKAAEEAGKAYETFKKDNPLRDIVTAAKSSFGKFAGNIPALAIIGSVVGISSVLIGVAYNKWKARILSMPFDPALIPLGALAADRAFTLIRTSPILETAFKDKLEEGDRNFMRELAKDFVSTDKEVGVLWADAKYKACFESRDAFEIGLHEYRMAAAYLELESESGVSQGLPPGMDYKTFMAVIDKIRTDPDAEKDLDLLMEVVEGLKKSDEPVISIFEKIKAEVEES